MSFIGTTCIVQRNVRQAFGYQEPFIKSGKETGTVQDQYILQQLY